MYDGGELAKSDPLGFVLSAALYTGKAQTCKAYQSDWADFVRSLGFVNAKAAVASVLRNPATCGSAATQYIGILEARGLKGSTISRRLACLRRVVRVAAAHGIGGVFAVPVEYKADAADSPVGPERDDVTRVKRWLMERAESQRGYVALRDLAMFDLLYHGAFRQGEVRGLRVCDVDVEGRRVAMRRKGQNERHWVPVTAATALCLGDVLGLHPRRSEEAALFVSSQAHDGVELTASSVGRLVAGWCRAAGVARIRPHGFRHAAVTALIDGSGNFADAQALAGHKSPATTLRYDDAQGRRRVAASRLLQEGVL